MVGYCTAAKRPLWATVGLCELASANVVGYQNKELKGNSAFNLTVATFKTVGKSANEMTLGDITASSDWITGGDEIKTLLANGAVDKAYTFVGAADAADWHCPLGWYLTVDVNDDTIEDLTPCCKNNDPLPLGNGLLVLVASAETTLTYVGEVLSADQPIALKGNSAFNITGNISPVDITLGDITASSDWIAGGDEIKTLLANGAVDKAYTFVGAADAADWHCPVGWYLTADVNDDSIEDLTPCCKNDVSVKAGEAFIVLVASAETTITIPSAL